MPLDTLRADAAIEHSLDTGLGYLNFSSGAADHGVMQSLDDLYRAIEGQPKVMGDTVAIVHAWLVARLGELHAKGGPFTNIDQAEALLTIWWDYLIPSYEVFHHDLLFHQPRNAIWRPFFVGCAWEVILSAYRPDEDPTQIVSQAIAQLNDYVGYRPVAVLEDRACEPYKHERIRPIPLYFDDVGTATGRYEALIQVALDILKQTDPDILHQAWFDLKQVEELSLDPRAYDFDHPANRRPNYHFGQWDPDKIDNKGFYRRFILQQVTLDALLAQVDQAPVEDCEERLYEAGAVLAGTILMASGTSGNGPGCHDSTVTLQTLLPHIAIYRDQFYNALLEQVPAPRGKRLRAEAEKLQQPFGSARQHLNRELAKRRAIQLQYAHLAILFAQMGYPNAAARRADTVRVPSARIITKLHCLLTTAHAEIDRGQLEDVPDQLAKIEDLLHRCIACGALVDPWNIVGFGGNFSLFPAVENSIHDFRVDKLVELVEQILGLCARAWSEAAARDDGALEIAFSEPLTRMAAWWDQFATSTVEDVKHLVGKDVEISANLVAGALNSWHKAGAAAGDIAFWRMFIDQFDTPEAFQLVINALLEQGDCVASMALMMQWINQAERMPLKSGDSSFHRLVVRWLDLAMHEEAGNGKGYQSIDPWWPRIQRFFELLEANAESYWEPPTTFLDRPHRRKPAKHDEHSKTRGDEEYETHEEDEDDENGGLYSAAYEDVVFQGSTEDGVDSNTLGEGESTKFEFEYEAKQLRQQLRFLGTVALLWNRVAIRAAADASCAAADRSRGTADISHAAADASWLENCRPAFVQWQIQAGKHYQRLLQLLEAVHGYPLQATSPTQAGLIEYDRRRAVKDSLMEEIVASTAEMAHSARLLAAASQAEASSRRKPAGDVPNGNPGADDTPSSSDHSDEVLAFNLAPGNAPSTGQDTSDRGAAVSGRHATAPRDVLHALLNNDGAAVRRRWPDLAAWLHEHGLLYVPLSRGGDPIRIVDAKARQRLVRALLEWMPRFGLIGPTCELLQVAHDMELEHPIGHGAVTEFDRLFKVGYMAMVHCLVASSEDWKIQSIDFGDALCANDSRLVDSLQRLAESQLDVWLDHSHTLRLSIVEKVLDADAWQRYVAFVKRYGGDLFTQGFLSLGNIRAILHQGVDTWFDDVVETHCDEASCRLIKELDDTILRREAVRWLSFTLEAVAENYREYRDYNATTTQSDRGEMFDTFIDFLRLRVEYDRIAWNLRPVVLAHEVLARQGRSAAAEEWRRALTARTADVADEFQRRHVSLCAQHGMMLPTVASRIAERFARPLDIGRIRGLIKPAVHAARDGETNAAFALLEQEADQITREPCGAGLEIPDWLVALEEEVDRAQAMASGNSTSDLPTEVEQAHIAWVEFTREMEGLE